MHICMIAYAVYETDNRIIRYVETLVKEGYQVDIISLRSGKQFEFKKIPNIRIFHIQKRTFTENTGKISYLFRLIKFFIFSSIFFTIKHLKNKYDLVHVHSIPDFEVFAAWFGKITGAKIILDIHDIVPEFYACKFDVSNKSFIFKLLVFIEKISIAFSDHVIVSNHLWEKTLINRSVKQNKCVVILNYPDLSIFTRRPKSRKDNKFIVLYHGSLNYHQGIDIAIKAFSIIKDKLPFAELHIYAMGHEKHFLMNLIEELRLNDRVFLKEPVPHTKIANIIANVELGLVPKRNEAFGNEAFSTKSLEFMAMGIPLLISDTKIDKYYFDEKKVKYFKSGDEEDLARNIFLLYKNEKLRDQLVLNGLDYIKKNNWDLKKKKYLDLLNNLLK